jgi:5-methylcytosine-specific restriction endonuclease McrA
MRTARRQESSGINSRGGSRKWRALRDQVVKEEPLCRLRLPGCTVRSTTADHILLRALRPDLAMTRSNLRGACTNCNLRRGRKLVRPQAAAVNGKPSAPRARALQWFD